MSVEGDSVAVDAVEKVEDVAAPVAAPVVVDHDAAREPQSDFARQLADEAKVSRDTARTNTNRKTGVMDKITSSVGKLFRINPYMIEVDPGFNPRDFSTLSNQNHVDGLARSIAKKGVLTPLTVYVRHDDEQGSVPVVTDGHSRLLAVFRAIEVYGAQIATVPVLTEDRGTSVEERALAPILRNTGKVLDSLELSFQLRKLMSFGWSLDRIHDETSIAKQRVEALVELQSVPDTVKTMIKEGAVSGSMVMGLQSRGVAPEKIEAQLRAGREAAEKEGRQRMLPRHAGVDTASSKRKTLKSLYQVLRSEGRIVQPAEDAPEEEQFVLIKFRKSEHVTFERVTGLLESETQE